MTNVSLAFTCDVEILNDPETVNINEQGADLVLLGDLETAVTLSIYSRRKQDDVFSIDCNKYYFEDSLLTQEKRKMRKVFQLGFSFLIPNEAEEDSMKELMQSGRYLLVTLIFKTRAEAEQVQNILHDLETDLKQGLHDRTMDELHLECSASGKFDIGEYARGHIVLFRLWNRNYEKTIDEMTAYLENRISEMVRQGMLSGFVDKHMHMYTDRQLVPSEQKVVNVNIQMDFNALVQGLGNKGVILTNIACPQCGNPASLPEQGAMFSCPACGSLIKVTDVYDMFKNLLE